MDSKKVDCWAAKTESMLVVALDRHSAAQRVGRWGSYLAGRLANCWVGATAEQLGVPMVDMTVVLKANVKAGRTDFHWVVRSALRWAD